MGIQTEGGYRVPAEKSPLPADLVCDRAFLLPTPTPDLALEDSTQIFIVCCWRVLNTGALHSILLLNYVP